MLGIYVTRNPEFQYAASVESFGEEAFRQLQDLYMRAFVQADANYQAVEKNTTEDGGVKYMAKDGMEMMSFVPRGRKVNADLYIEERHGLLLEDIRKHLHELQNMPPVCDLDGTEFQKNESDTRSLKQKVKDFFDGIGNKVERKELGIIALNNAGAQDSVEHGYGPIKAACFAALPAVLEKGLMFGPTQYLGRGHDTYLFVAPVRFVGVENGEFFVGAYVIKDVNTTRYKIHEVLTISKEGNRPFQPEADQNGERLRDDSLPASTVAQTDPIVNTESTQAIDVELDENTGSAAPKVLKSKRNLGKNHTKTQQFKRWFGDWEKHPDKASKVVNADGTPKVVYHGSAEQFNIFSYGHIGSSSGVSILGDGFYFTDKKKLAKNYGKNVYGCYLQMKTPYKATEADAYKLNTQKLQAQGYDGVILESPSGKIYMVFDNTQIKSATDNIGTFDGSNPDIRYSDRDYSYEALTSKPDMKVTAVGGTVPNNRADVVFQAKQNAAKVGKFNHKDGSVSVHVDDIDADVILGTKGLVHGLRRLSTSQTDPTWMITLQAGAIIKNAIRINEVTPSKKEASGTYVLIGAAQNSAGDLYVVRFVVNQFSNELASLDVLYAINAKKEDRLRSMRPGVQRPVTDPTISIAELLDLVNQHFPDILPEYVLKHYGYDARPEGDLGEDALYQDRDTDSVSNRSLLANALEGVVQNDLERQKLAEYRENISQLDAQEEKLSQLNAQIRELVLCYNSGRKVFDYLLAIFCALVLLFHSRWCYNRDVPLSHRWRTDKEV